jgi:hypothetical protein
MIQAFDKKVIIFGNEVEYYEYRSKPILRGYHRRARKKKIKKDTELQQLEKMQSSINRTRKAIRYLVQANPQLTKFLTLTCTMTDLKQANKEFNLFTQRMKDRFSEFQYLAVIEFQKDVDFHGKIKLDGGAVHYHVLCQLRYVPAKEIGLDIWKHGGIDIERLKGNMWGYISKYLQKDMTDRRMFGKKKYFCSQDLKRPIEFLQDDAVFFMEAAQKDLVLRSEDTFYNEYSGEVVRKLFRFKEGVV